MGIRDYINPDSFVGLYLVDTAGLVASYLGMQKILGYPLNPSMALEMAGFSALLTAAYEGGVSHMPESLKNFFGSRAFRDFFARPIISAIVMGYAYWGTENLESAAAIYLATLAGIHLPEITEGALNAIYRTLRGIYERYTR